MPRQCPWSPDFRPQGSLLTSLWLSFLICKKTVGNTTTYFNGLLRDWNPVTHRALAEWTTSICCLWNAGLITAYLSLCTILRADSTPFCNAPSTHFQEEPCSSHSAAPQFSVAFRWWSGLIHPPSAASTRGAEPAFPATRPWNSICTPCVPPPSNHSRFLRRLRAPSLHLVLFFSTAQILRLWYTSNKRKID